MNIKKRYLEKRRKKRLPILAVCRNCGTNLHGRYCHYCGQDLFRGTRRTVSNMVFHSMENIFAVDNKLFVTLKYLLFRPGKLTKEYIDGKIVRYVHPSKLFWFISILFFILLSFSVSDNKDAALVGPNTTPETSVSTDAPTKDLSQTTAQNTTSTNKTAENKDVKKKTEEHSVKNYKIKSTFMKFAPYASFLCIPFFAFLLKLFSRRRNIYYVDNLTFALHFHAFVFLLFSIYLLYARLFPNVEHEIWFFVVIPLIYFIIALWTVYRPRISTLLFKTATVMFLYGVTILCMLILLSVFAYTLSEGISELKNL